MVIRLIEYNEEIEVSSVNNIGVSEKGKDFLIMFDKDDKIALEFEHITEEVEQLFNFLTMNHVLHKLNNFKLSSFFRQEDGSTDFTYVVRFDFEDKVEEYEFLNNKVSIITE